MNLITRATAIMNRRLYFQHGFSVIIAAFVLTLALSGTAQAIGLSYKLDAYQHDYMSGQQYTNAQSQIMVNGYWRASTNNWWLGDGTLHALAAGWYAVSFKRVQDFYVPGDQIRYVDNDYYYTNYYYIYSNTLSVVVTGMVGGASATWRLTGYPANEYTNSSFYGAYTNGLFTNNATFTTIPTGTYSISFNAVRGHYTAPATNINITGALTNFSTNTYLPYTNGLSVVVAGTSGTNAVWTLSTRPDEYTNCTLTNINFTNNYTITPIPTGTYVVTFPDLSGYTTPAAVTSAVTSGTNTVTGTYASINGHLEITMTPDVVTSTAPWVLSGYPAGYTNAIFSGTGKQTISNVIIGTYTVTFGAVAGYTTPAADSDTVLSNALATILGAYTFNGYTLVLHLGPPFTRQQSLAGIGSGPCRVQYDGTITTQTAAQASYAIISNNTVTLTALTNYVYKWYINAGGGLASGIDSIALFSNAYSLVMNSDYDIWLLYSASYTNYDNAGDIDHDQLPDRWEITWFGDGGNTESATAPQAELFTNTYANGDADFIPSSSTNPPTRVSIGTNIITYSGAGGSVPAYPLLRSRLLSPQEAGVSASALGYSTGTKFNNFLECRGLDGYYLTNGPTGGIASDDPLTDPTKDDTDTDGLTDGWEYYFWYWRSAYATSAGLSNSANLGWVTLRATVWNMPDWDTDSDDIDDLTEHDDYWTDPTHCDTDADSIDDYWEISFTGASSNALDYVNSWANPDNDYMAWTNLGVLTTGMVGTALGTNVCYTGASNNPTAAWWDLNNNDAFNLYSDVVFRASAALTNTAAGTQYAYTNYYGTNAGLTAYKNGYPVWVDVDSSGTYTTNDYALVNPTIKHEAIYTMAPATVDLYPGVCSFNPYRAWTNPISISVTNGSVTFTASGSDPFTIPYTTYQEYLGADYIGRLSWNAGGQMSALNDDANALNRNSYSYPTNQDTDADSMPDGWELYVGLDDNNAADAGTDSDEDDLSNFAEWSNATHPLGTCVATWPNKFSPTDPGFLTAPQPNDRHPRDTDWDGITDGGEMTYLTCPTLWDTDADHLPDSWEVYAGSAPLTNDASADLDGDGLRNYQEYWCGTVPEWMLINPDWQTTYFCARRAMAWDPFSEPEWGRVNNVFIPPDYISDPCFMYVNAVYTNLANLRTNYPAAYAWSAPSDPLTVPYYHTPLANNADSDGDNMDDYWEVYHGLNPCRGIYCTVIQYAPRTTTIFGNVDLPDADPAASGYQFGFDGSPFNSLLEYIQTVAPYRNDPDERITQMTAIVGPFNFGLNGMDPEGDGLPNLEEYSYSRYRAFYHTDPSPVWRTDQHDTDSFSVNNYTFDMAPSEYFKDWGAEHDLFPFRFETVEGYDTDNDGVSDYAEINSAAGQTGNNPLDDRNPIRNRALYFNGTNDFARQVITRAAFAESDLARFCVEAWIKPDNPSLNTNQVVLEKAGRYNNPLDPGNYIVGANFRLGVTNGLPYVLYNGRGSLRAYQATAKTTHRITSNTNWTHIAGSYDGTNLIIYVNGEESYSLRTTELPANGFDVWTSSNEFAATAHTLIVGARDNNAGRYMFSYTPSPADYFGGCVDEVRVWNGVHTRAEILANKNRRLTQDDITNAMPSIYNYFTFDDVPDTNRTGESAYPAGMAVISFDMHPTISWWQIYSMRSTVYTGVSNLYNYIVYADDHAWHSRAVAPAYDDYYHFSTNYLGTNTLSGYTNPGNPYHYTLFNFNRVYDLLLFRGARAVATNSWLSGLTTDPDSTDSDGDGLPDSWEQSHNLDPNDATGDNGAWGDPDHDGLNNRAEYLAGTDPRNSDTAGDGIGDYDSRSGPYHRTWGEMFMDGDGMPDTWEIQYGLDPYHYDANLDLDGDGWSNYAEYQGGTNPNDATSYPQPHVTGTVSYFGNKSGTFSFYVYNTNTMDGVPVIASAGGGTNATAFDLTGFKEGDFYMLAALDTTTLGLMEEQPLTMGYSSISNVRVQVKDTAPGYGRFSWTASTTSTTDYPVVINKISSSGSPTVLTRTMRWSRNIFHEWDYQLAGYYGLSAGQYQWWMNSQQGTFSVTWPASLSTPSLVYPRGEALNYARNQFKWTMDSYATRYHLQVARQNSDRSLSFVIDNYYPTPYRDADGISQAYLPKYAGELGDGVYYWRVAGWNPAGESAWSEQQSFEINLSGTNSHWIAGSIYYFGKADSANIIVEAFDNRGFSGKPEARILLNPTVSRTNAFKGAFTLRGLEEGTYYVRAYLDVTPAGGTRDDKRNSPWESWGFIRDPNNDYQPRAIALLTTMFVDGTKLVIRDQDIDNDLLPDAWEMYYFGNLDQTGDMDYDGDGETNLEEYMRDGYDMNPASWDTDGDGLSDTFEMNYTAPSFGYSAKSGIKLNPNAWDTDDDGYSDGAEMKRYHTDPLDPTSYPGYRPMCFGWRRSPADYDGDGRSDLTVYDVAGGDWYLMNADGLFFTLPFGAAATQPMLGDYSGDGADDFALFDSAAGDWHLYDAWTGQSFSMRFGDSEMMPVPADYTGDGKTDLALYYPAEGTWFIYNLWNGQLYTFTFGGPTYMPVPGDYNGDGGADLAVYEAADGNWDILAYHLYTHEFQHFSGNFGGPTYVPVPGDYDGDGRNDAALFDTSTGNWHLLTWQGQYLSGQFGWYGCIPVAGDYDGDGRSDVCVYYPPSGMWYIYCWSGQSYQVQFGFPAATPIIKGRM